MRKILFTVLAATALKAQAQTLFTIGSDSVSVADFLYAYKKNNTGPQNAQAMENYLQLFIASRLKVMEATARGLDTTAQFRADLEALRAQIIPAYLNDPESLRRLTEEAFVRSQKDLQLAHVFVSVNGPDTAAAHRKATEAASRLRSGVPFSEVASQYSDDPAAKTNGGNLGFITVFSLPYELENLAYNTPVGQTTALYRSKAGYHLFRVVAERPAAGRMQAAQILLAYPPDAGNAEKYQLRKRADSLYQALQRGAAFDALAERFSNDAVSAGAGGLLPEFGVGQYHPVFEQEAFALAKDGAVSKPFETEYGIHILRRVKRLPVSQTRTDAILEQLRLRVQQSDRMESTRSELAQLILKRADYQPLPAPMMAALRTRTQQQAAGNTPADALPGGTVLLSLGKDTATVEQWLEWIRNNRFGPDGSTELPFEAAWSSFVQEQALKHYQRNLEIYSEDFRRQLAELREGNLFFEIMQQEVWTPAQNDTVALKAFYEQNKARYRWDRSADAVFFYAGNKAAAQKLAAQVRQAPARWRELAGRFAEEVTTDSARVDWSTLQGTDKLPFASKQVTTPVVNEADGTASFALVLRVYKEPIQRSFEEAKGAIINDYQLEKEKEWVAALKKKYPVRMLRSLP